VDWFGFQAIFVTTAILQVPFRPKSCHYLGCACLRSCIALTSTAQLC